MSKVREVMGGDRIPYIDMHCDTLLFSYMEGADRVYQGNGMQSLRQQFEGGQMLQFYAVFFPPKALFEHWLIRKDSDGNTIIPTDDDFFRELAQNLRKEVEKHSDIAGMALTAADVRANAAEGKISAMLTIEDGRFINGDMEKLHYAADQGVRAIALTWNEPNCFGFPNSRDPQLNNKGLTDFGKEAIPEMEKLGILVDVSHLSDGGFYDVAHFSKKPFIASHSGSRSITSHPRNLTDEMIRILSENGGVAGVNFFQEFAVPDSVRAEIPGADAYLYGSDSEKAKAALSQQEKNKLETHISYLVRHVKQMYQAGGEDVIAIGTDFDGFDGKPEIHEPKEMQKLFEALRKEGFTERQIEKFAFRNVLRVLDSLS